MEEPHDPYPLSNRKAGATSASVTMSMAT